MLTSAEYVTDHAPQDVCPDCPFGGPKVGSKGDPASPIVFVAESPGIEEKRIGEPLVGASGRVFHKFVPDDGSVYVLNAMECYPARVLKQKAAGEKRMQLAAHSCRDRLLRKIEQYPHRLIVAMGNPATRSLTGLWDTKITQVRGRLIPSYLSTLGIMPVVHVAALMHGTGSFRQWRQDIEYAMELGLGADPRVHLKAEVEIIPDDVHQQYVDDLFGDLDNELTCDIETTGLSHINHRILSIGVTPSNNPGISYCFYPIHLPLLKPYLESASIEWCWHNGKFDIKFLRAAGVRAKVDDDTMLLSYSLDELGGVHDLETVSCDVLGAPDYKYMIQPYLPNKDSSYELVPPPILAVYQAIDTSNTAQIRPIYRERVRKDPKLEKLYTKTLLPASEMLTQVEENGICTDPKRLDENEVYFNGGTDKEGNEVVGMKHEIGAEINEMAGYSLNPGSYKQLQKLLFGKMKFPNRNKGSTDEDTLTKLQKQTEHPIFALILKHRKAVKMYGTYVKGFRKHVHALTQRIHATFLLHGTRTGRLAAREPNLQNPPRDPQIRGTFVAAEGYELVEVDLSQAEIRSLAALSGDPILCDLFQSGGSPHKDLSIYFSDVGTYKPDWEERYAKHILDPGNLLWLPAKEEYIVTKNVNFGIMYGITEFGLQGQIGGTIKDARILIRGWYERYNVAKKFIDRCRGAPLNNFDITTCFGRRKRTGIVSRENKHFLQNEAANFPHQSIASDITLHAAIRCWKKLLAIDVRIVNLIHDALLMEVPITPDNHIRHEVICMVAREMRQIPIDWGITRVPFIAEGDYGHRWGTLQAYKENIYD